jgi:hypothetical protein
MLYHDPRRRAAQYVSAATVATARQPKLFP